MNLDIACGAYLMNGGTHYPIVEKFDNEYFLKNGAFEFLSREGLREKKNNLKSCTYLLNDFRRQFSTFL